MNTESVRILWPEFKSLILPAACLHCERPMAAADEAFCGGCTAAWSADSAPACPRCGSTVGQYALTEGGCTTCFGEYFHFESVLRLGPYRDDLRTAVLRMKQARQEPFAHRFAVWWAARMKVRLSSPSFDWVVPVPLHWRRRWSRGFNQCEFLARAIAGELKIPCTKSLKRIRRGDDQKTLSGTERRRNLRDAYAAASAGDLKNRCLLLVDDVSTSGATANACARALRKAGAREVHVAIVAKG